MGLEWEEVVGVVDRGHLAQTPALSPPPDHNHHLPPCRMMPGLLEGQEKMSKSDPNSAIFMEDSEMDVNSKIKKAFCPPQVRCMEGPCPGMIQWGKGSSQIKAAFWLGFAPLDFTWPPCGQDAHSEACHGHLPASRSAPCTM